MKQTFYRSGAELSVQGRNQAEGRQLITALRRDGIRRCFKDGCERYEKGYNITVDLNDKEDANTVRYIREGKAGRHSEELLLHGLARFHFPAGECPGHKLDWQDDPVYIVGQRRATHDEFQHRYQAGSEALVAATTRALEMKE